MPTAVLPNGQRLNFPDSMSTDEINEAIFKNFPEYAPKEAQQKNHVLKNIMSDIGSRAATSLENLPESLMTGLMNLPGEAYQGAKFAVSHPGRAAFDIAAAPGELAESIQNLPEKVSRYLQSQGLQGAAPVTQFLQKHVSLPEEGFGIEKALGYDKPLQGEEFLKSMAQLGPVGRAESLLTKGLGLTGEGAAKAAGRAAVKGATFGGAAAAQGQDPLTAALAAQLLETGAKGIGKGAKAIRSTTARYPTRLSADELRQALEATKGTQTSLGRVIENPDLMKLYENKLAALPRSGVTEQMNANVEHIVNRGNKLLEDMKPKGLEGSPTQAIQDALKDAYEDVKAEKKANFKELNDLANKEGIKVGRNNIRTVAQQYLSKLNQDQEGMRSADPGLVDDLKYYASPKKGGGLLTDLETADLARGDMGEKKFKHYIDNNKRTNEVYSSLKNAIQDDINKAFNMHKLLYGDKNSKLAALRDKAFEHYKNVFAPFEEDEILKFTKRGGDSDLILDNFLKRSRTTDRPILLNKLMSKLPDQSKGIVPYAYYSRAIKDGKLDPLALKRLDESLMPNQRKVLLGDNKIAKDLVNYNTLAGKNTDAINAMFNPQTGKRVGDIATGLIPALINASAALGGGHIAGVPGALAGAILAPEIVGRAARPIAKHLTDETVREKVIRQLIKEKEAQGTPKESTRLSKLLSAKNIGRSAALAANQDKENQ